MENESDWRRRIEVPVGKGRDDVWRFGRSIGKGGRGNVGRTLVQKMKELPHRSCDDNMSCAGVRSQSLIEARTDRYGSPYKSDENARWKRGGAERTRGDYHP